jgi:hypothetical protein
MSALTLEIVRSVAKAEGLKEAYINEKFWVVSFARPSAWAKKWSVFASMSIIPQALLVPVLTTQGKAIPSYFGEM